MSYFYRSQKPKVLDDIEIFEFTTAKANVVADVLSQKSPICFESYYASLTLERDSFILVELRLKPVFLVRIQELHKSGVNDCLYFRDSMCVPDDLGLKNDLLNEAHNSVYSIHLGSNKMYNDLK
ncbi:integrase [Gossypium australe]|uniref:Integrase n=1 Tax=Gossypium australe TaxID=47621 RepID=A0A5B6WQD0_9ROSI|nr:integrase [Gossypium australe]